MKMLEYLLGEYFQKLLIKSQAGGNISPQHDFFAPCRMFE